MKFKKVLVSEIEEQKRFRKEQDRLKEKHSIQDVQENIIIVEKSNMFKFLIRAIGSIIRVVASILILVLAAIGLLALVYQETRIPLFDVLKTIRQGYFFFF